MALCKNHKWIYFDTLRRVNKAETVFSLIAASFHVKSKDEDGRKQEIANNLVFAYNLFFGNAGSYSGDLGQFASQYTIGHELGIWKNSKLELNAFALLVAENKITIKDYFDRVFLNYFQPVNDVIIHPLYHIINYLIENHKREISKEEITSLFTKITKSMEEKKLEGTNSLFNMMIGTNYFVSNDDKDGLIYVGKYDLTFLKEKCDITYLGKTYEDANNVLHNVEDYVEYLIHEKKDNPKSGEKKMTKPFTPLNYKPLPKESKTKEYNRIIFGAPGTGKSYELNKYVDPTKTEFTFDKAHFERVTFHPEYTYAQFVGCYKPVSDGNNISYEYVPGPFMRTLVASLESGKNGTSAEKFLLIVEEINRAKVAAVFGDMFQLLDRTAEGDSEYEIQASEDVRRYLAEKLGGISDDYKELKLPNNFYIWATMNSADQGVQPMDTAFKRRWEGYEYLGINDNDRVIRDITIPLPFNGSYELFNWNRIRREINTKLKDEANINEDKLIGPFFISKHTLDEYNGQKDKGADFSKLFKSKILMYLFEDAAKMAHSKVFPSEGIKQHYSDICEKFDTDGLGIFGLKAEDFKVN